MDNRKKIKEVYDSIVCKVDISKGAYWGCGEPLYVEFTLDKSYVHFFRE